MTNQLVKLISRCMNGRWDYFCCNYMYSFSAMLLLITIVLGSIVPHISCENLTKQHSSNDTLIKSKLYEKLIGKANATTLSNSTSYLNGDSISKTRPRLALELVSTNGETLRQFEKQINRHSYNLTTPANTNVTTSIVTTNQSSSVASPPGRDKSFESSAQEDQLDLDTSNSRYIPSRSNSQLENSLDEPDNSGNNSDHDVDEDYTNETENENSFIDSASSNMNEKKVVKELTKILSKGMSGATDQVRLETLETLKRRQRERKALKDNRAKLFEDLLTAAINSHPEKFKSSPNKIKQHSRDHQFSSSSRSKQHQQSGSNSINFSNAQEVDPDLATDAETVLQHLHGLAAAIDTHSPSSYNHDLPSTNLLASAADEQGSDEGSNNNNEGGNFGNNYDSNENTIEVDEKPRKPANSERPLVRQFKKFKNQISQRRKQLEHIKKLFNVELAIKDGTLVGRPNIVIKTKKKNSASNPTTTTTESSVGYMDYADDSQNSPIPTASKRKSSKESKMNELMNYLRDNPEILASVMAELTTDADPSRPTSRHELGSSTSGDHSIDGPNGRRSPSRDYPEADNLSYNLRLRKLAKHNYDMSRSSTPMRFRHRASSTNVHSVEHSAGSLGSKTAEALLLESLRERQLMNLARLERVLAAKQGTTNRTYAENNSHNSSHGSISGIGSIDRFDQHRKNYDSPGGGNHHNYNNTSVSSNNNNNFNGRNELNYGSYQSARNYAPLNGTRTNHEEVTHHFVMVNPSGQNNETMSPIGQQIEHSLMSDLNHSSHSALAHPHHHHHHQLSSGSYPSAVKAYDSHGHQYGTQAMLNQPTMNLHSNNPLQQQQQQSSESSSLDRFRSWRDVSHSEASPTQYEWANTPMANATSGFPYDLSTGGSATPVDTRPQQSMNVQQNRSSLSRSSNHPSIEATSSPYSLLDSASFETRSQQVADSSVTRPGGQVGHLGNLHRSEAFQQPPSDESTFMTRSSVAQQTAEVANNYRRHHDNEARKAGDGMLAGELATNRREDPDEDGDQIENANDKVSQVDYFSLYKKELPSKPQRLASVSSRQENAQLTQQPNMKQRKTSNSNREEEPEGDDMGAMWA